ncbi:DUF4381 domain-containing protein [Marinicella meishanensis]|uniref:DUF4381 domain-containing protein n=1 Tax=Marinicella meishanensis TaxID=2873263 RepID=UPI001CBE0EA5|nr:DUF4381 domain-containing protein [Marinicella sp. NBU2979]
MQGLAPDALPLRDLKLPAEPGFWPLAPGWWVVMVLLTVLLLGLFYWWRRYRQKKQRWAQIEQQLTAIELAYDEHQDRQHLLTELSAFLRRFVRFQLQQKRASSLAGEAWLRHLDALQPGAFAGYEQALTEGVYAPQFDCDVEHLLQTTRQFIKRHVLGRPAKTPTEVADV